MYSCSRRAVHDSLHEIDCDPKDISAVVLTRTSTTPEAGPADARNEDDTPEPRLPQRRDHRPAPGMEDAIAGRSTMNKTYLPSHLTQEVADRVRLIEGEQEVLPTSPSSPRPGTPGASSPSASPPRAATAPTAGRFVSDVMPTHHHARPTTNLAYDVEPYTSMLSHRPAREGHQREADPPPNHDPAGQPAVRSGGRSGQARQWDLKSHG